MADKNMEAQISVEFEEATSRQSLNSGETINTLWGKVKRWLSDLKVVCFSGSYNDLSDTPTTATKDTDGLMSAKDKSKLDSVNDTYALKSLYGDTTINVGRKEGTVVGIRSTAEGQNTTASNACSHAEGSVTEASGVCSHAEGVGTVASGAYSHSEGDDTTASGVRSHAGGGSSVASGDSSFAHGMHVKSNNSSETSFGKFNKSSSDTLFSVGDGDSDTARHNAFEITTTGGKLHDKDIATTDIIPDLTPYAKKTDVPNIKVNAAVNADTVGGKLPDKIFYENGMSSDLDSATESGCYAASPDTLNVPYSMWWLVDTMNYNGQFIVQKAHTIGDTSTTVSYIRNYANNAWSDWTEIYTAGNKPYITGSATVEANSRICVTNHGFMPSNVIWWDNGISSFSLSFDDKQFTIDVSSDADKTIYYLIFK